MVEHYSGNAGLEAMSSIPVEVSNFFSDSFAIA